MMPDNRQLKERLQGLARGYDEDAALQEKIGHPTTAMLIRRKANIQREAADTIERLEAERDAENKRAQEFPGAIWEAWTALKRIAEASEDELTHPEIQDIAAAAIPPNRTDGAEAKLATLEAERDLSVEHLAECYRLTGADPDGDSDSMLASNAVEEVRRLAQQRERDAAVLEALTSNEPITRLSEVEANSAASFAGVVSNELYGRGPLYMRAKVRNAIQTALRHAQEQVEK